MKTREEENKIELVKLIKVIEFNELNLLTDNNVSDNSKIEIYKSLLEEIKYQLNAATK